MTMSQPNGDEEPIFEWPITDTLDLHSVPPREVTAVVEAWLEAVWERGFIALRIVHGKGIGVQREAVRKVLGRTPFVAAFADAPMEAGGWGATVVTLASRRPDSPDPARR
jgi:dsDNA-specific endonuclease/ATPase MutS2